MFANVMLKPLWQRLQTLLGYEAWHTCIWGVSPILCQVGWGVSLHSYFQVSPEMFDWVQVRPLAGPLKDIQRHPKATPALSWLCA
jgi:hypothetical protein